jgi:hypothetical protein
MAGTNFCGPSRHTAAYPTQDAFDFGKRGNQNRTCAVLQLRSVPTILLTGGDFIRC